MTASTLVMGPRRARKDRRPWALTGLVLAILLIGALVQWLPGRGIEVSTRVPAENSIPNLAALGEESATNPTARGEAVQEVDPVGELGRALKQARAQIEAGKFDDAIRTLNQMRPLAGNSAPTYHQLGRALIGRGDYAVARDFLQHAIDIDPTLAEVYFDHARASEGMGDRVSALGGMRTFLHLVKDADPFRLPVAQARSAIWEWEAQLGRGIYGPTKGIPPGFTAEQIKRDGKGVGTMMQKPETLRPDGTMDYEIKAGERHPNLWKK